MSDLTDDEFIIVKGRKNILSNFFDCRFIICGITFGSLEHAYQYLKAKQCGLNDLSRDILNAPGPVECKRLGARVKLSIKHCESLMWYLLNEKLRQCPGFKKSLIATGDKHILHSTYPGDGLYWCTGLLHTDHDRHKKPTLFPGMNKFGKLLMDLRNVAWEPTDTDIPMHRPLCLLCSQLGRKSNYCPQKGKTFECAICSIRGHGPRDCPLRRNRFFCGPRYPHHQRPLSPRIPAWSLVGCPLPPPPPPPVSLRMTFLSSTLFEGLCFEAWGLILP